jgi:hypothetical protein
MARNDIIIKDTHRALLYQDGVLVKTLEAGRYEPPRLKGMNVSYPSHGGAGCRRSNWHWLTYASAT